jgi:hypothetical protein
VARAAQAYDRVDEDRAGVARVSGEGDVEAFHEGDPRDPLVAHGGEHVTGAEVDRLVIPPSAEGRHDGFAAGYRPGDRLRIEYVAHHDLDARGNVSVRGSHQCPDVVSALGSQGERRCADEPAATEHRELHDATPGVKVARSSSRACWSGMAKAGA